MQDVLAITNAVLCLKRHSSEYPTLKKRILDLTELYPNAGFIGDRAVLNPLVELAKEDRHAFDNVLMLLNRDNPATPERGEIQKLPERSKTQEPERHESHGTFDKTDYQRVYVRRMRQRVRQAIKLEQQRLGRELSPDEKSAFDRAKRAQWMSERDKLIAELVPNAKRNSEEWRQAGRLYWEKLDSELGLTNVN